MRDEQEPRDHHEREAVLFASAVRALAHHGYSHLEFDIGGKKARRRYVSGQTPDGNNITIWIKSSTHWPGIADAVRFPWKKLSSMQDGQEAIIIACEAAARRGATHLLAVSGDDKTGILTIANMFSLTEVLQLSARQSALINSVFFRAHSAALILKAYSREFEAAAKAAESLGENMLSEPRNVIPIRDDGDVVRARSGRVYRRDPKVRAEVLKIAKGHCECCGVEGFVMQNGDQYLETHHVVGVSERGPDSVDNIVAICPMCHRKAHFAADHIEIELKMLEAIRRRGRLGREE